MIISVMKQQALNEINSKLSSYLCGPVCCCLLLCLCSWGGAEFTYLVDLRKGLGATVLDMLTANSLRDKNICMSIGVAHVIPVEAFRK